MEIERSVISETEGRARAALPEKKSRLKTGLRLKYEAEVSLIKKEVGDLEDIRRALGLSQRKICQLLLVDPSAWTRWTRDDSKVPPHVYRALSWFLEAQKNQSVMPYRFKDSQPADPGIKSRRTFPFLWKALIFLNFLSTIWLIWRIQH